MTFGEKLKEIRLSHGMSQQEFADLLHTTKQVISRYELEQTTPKISVAANFCKILNISLDSMINDDITIALCLTTHESKVIAAYREKPPVQPAVDKLLDVLPEEISPITHPFGKPKNARKETSLDALYGNPQDTLSAPLRAADPGFQNLDEFFSIKSKDKKEK